MASVLFNAGLFIAAVVCGYRFPRLLFRILLALMTLMLLALTIEAFTGWRRGLPLQQPLVLLGVHRGAGQGLTIVAWLLAMWGGGGSLAYAIKFRISRGCLSTACALITLGLSVLEGFTGFLLPNDPKLRATIGEETFNRFFVLHEIACPVLMLAVVSYWAWLAAAELSRLNGKHDRGEADGAS